MLTSMCYQMSSSRYSWDCQPMILITSCCRRSGLVIGNLYGPGEGTIWLEDVDCLGSETALEDCNHAGWGSTSCGHDNDVSITCATNLTNTIGKPHKKTQRIRTLKIDFCQFSSLIHSNPYTAGVSWSVQYQTKLW